MLKLIIEREGVVPFAVVHYVFFNSVCEIRYSLSSFMPAHSIFFVVSLFLRINTHFHAIIEKRITFCKVHDIELNICSFFGILDLEIKPLGMA